MRKRGVFIILLSLLALITIFTFSIKAQGNYEIVENSVIINDDNVMISDIEIDPNEIWIKHSQEKLGKIKVLENNNKAIVLLTMQEIPEETTTATEELPKSEVKSTGLKIVEPIKEKIEEVKSILTGSHVVSIVALICSLLAVIVICLTIYKIKTKI